MNNSKKTFIVIALMTALTFAVVAASSFPSPAAGKGQPAGTAENRPPVSDCGYQYPSDEFHNGADVRACVRGQ